MKNYHKIIVGFILPILSICSCAKKTDCGPDPVSVDFHSELQANYLKDAYSSISSYADGTKELSKPDGYKIQFDNPEHNNYVVHLRSEVDNRDFVTDAEEFIFNNLYLNTYYHYELRKDGRVYSQGDFQTTDVGPRNIDVEGVTNFRDLGGYLTNYGGRTKQGLIYRSAKFNANESDTPLITDKGRDVVVGDLKIKAEIDLRVVENNENGGLTESVIDSSVKYYAVPMRYDGTFMEINKQAIRDLFDIISQRDNFPFVFHCSIGTDRTGLVAFIINTLLQVRVEYIYRDYLFSNFGDIGSSRNTGAIDTYIATLANYQGDNLFEQMHSYLNSIGVEDSKLDSFTKIMEL